MSRDLGRAGAERATRVAPPRFRARFDPVDNEPFAEPFAFPSSFEKILQLLKF